MSIQLSNTTAPGSTAQEVIVTDGTDTLLVNPDGSINVVATGEIALDGGNVTAVPPEVVNVFQDTPAVAAGVLTEIFSYTAPSPKWVFTIAFSGENVATYTLKVNGTIWDRIRTSYVKVNDKFDLGGGVIALATSDSITVEAIHNGTTASDFEAKIQLREQFA